MRAPVRACQNVRWDHLLHVSEESIEGAEALAGQGLAADVDVWAGWGQVRFQRSAKVSRVYAVGLEGGLHQGSTIERGWIWLVGRLDICGRSRNSGGSGAAHFGDQVLPFRKL